MKLGVNIDHVATLREARRIDIPDPIKAAQISERAGCDSIVCHLREDRRHINDKDLKKLRKVVQTKLNLEMSCAPEIVRIVLKIKPDQATLVPERRQEVTTVGGLDVVTNQKIVSRTVESLKSAGILVSLFIDAKQSQIEMAKHLGVEGVELHTGKYANAHSELKKRRQLQELARGASFACKLGLQVFAGHGLNYDNVKKITEIKEIRELNIGHSIIAQAVFVGLENAVKQMLSLLRS